MAGPDNSARVASVSVDLDPIECYFRIHALDGAPPPAARHAILRRCLPRFRELFARHNLRATLLRRRARSRRGCGGACVAGGDGARGARAGQPQPFAPLRSGAPGAGRDRVRDRSRSPGDRGLRRNRAGWLPRARLRGLGRRHRHLARARLPLRFVGVSVGAVLRRQGRGHGVDAAGGAQVGQLPRQPARGDGAAPPLSAGGGRAVSRRDARHRRAAHGGDAARCAGR